MVAVRLRHAELRLRHGMKCNLIMKSKAEIIRSQAPWLSFEAQAVEAI